MDDFLRPDSDQVLPVTELTRRIKAQLEGKFKQLWVQGEISNLRRQSSGHIYFSLKDSGSQLPCVLFARDATRQSFELRDGMEVMLFGDISVYEPHGRYQFIAKIAIQGGQGRLQIEFDRLKRKLAAEGLFDLGRKRPLPELPMRIAVVTSPTGAAVRDFLRILRRRGYGGQIVIFPARVQGRGAAVEIASMLELAAKHPDFDLVVITRGGGSIEDLWAFNDEMLARAVAACPLPVISAVGHEIDTVLTDYAADKRAETPSGAAELISSLYLGTVQRFEAAQQQWVDWIRSGLSERQRSLRDLWSRMRIIAPERRIEHLGMKLDDMENRLSQSLKERLVRQKDHLGSLSRSFFEHHPSTRISLARQSLKNLRRRMIRTAGIEIKDRESRLNYLCKRLQNSNLSSTLRRGYAIIQKPDGSIIGSAHSARLEDRLTARFHDGNTDLKVQK